MIKSASQYPEPVQLDFENKVTRQALDRYALVRGPHSSEISKKVTPNTFPRSKYPKNTKLVLKTQALVLLHTVRENI